MKVQKRLSVMVLSLVLCCVFRVTAFAHEGVDLSRNGSISLAMTYEGKAVAGGTLVLYQAGEVDEDDGNYSFILTGEFQGSGASLGDISSAELAESLAEYASGHSLEGTQTEIGGDGTAVFSGLKPGLYLVVQTKAAEGYEAVSPFLVSVPMNEDGNYIYDVDATPKMSTLTPKKPTPVKPEKPNLPQTGQLNWPVPILSVLGLGLFFTGWALRYGKKEHSYEA